MMAQVTNAPLYEEVYLSAVRRREGLYTNILSAMHDSLMLIRDRVSVSVICYIYLSVIYLISLNFQLGMKMLVASDLRNSSVEAKTFMA